MWRSRAPLSCTGCPLTSSPSTTPVSSSCTNGPSNPGPLCSAGAWRGRDEGVVSVGVDGGGIGNVGAIK